MRAEARSRKPGYASAVAFSRSGNPATGDFGDAKLIRRFSDLPTDLTALEVRLPTERMLEEEAQHFPRRIRPLRISVGPGWAAA